MICPFVDGNNFFKARLLFRKEENPICLQRVALVVKEH